MKKENALQNAFDILVRNIIKEVNENGVEKDEYNLNVYDYCQEIDRIVRLIKLNY